MARKGGPADIMCVEEVFSFVYRDYAMNIVYAVLYHSPKIGVISLNL